MGRRRAAEKREVLPDPKFGSIIVTKFVNTAMYDGKKTVSEKILHEAFDYIQKKSNKPCLEVFEEALANVGPTVELKSRRVGGATYQVPVEVKPDRGMALGSMWLIAAAKKRGGKSMIDKLTNEFNSLHKDATTLQDQHNELLKLKEQYENDNQILQNNLEQFNKENETLKQNINLLTKQNESIVNEYNILKNNQEKNNYNEEEIKNLMEELNAYKMKAQENDMLKKHIEELEYQIQMMQERQEEEDVKEVKGDIIHDMSELEMITKKINKENKRIIINLLYKASADSDSAAVFHEKCDGANNTIVLVETKDGKRFGGYTTKSWKGNCVEKADSDAFIFSFDKMKTYDNIPGDDAIGCYPKFGPIFLGCQIKIFDNAFTRGGTTFEKELNFNTEEDYELTDGDRTFNIKEIEVYEVIPS